MLVKAIAFPVVMYGCDSWTIKKTESGKTDAFELRCYRRLLRVPLMARRSNHSVLKEINPQYSLEGLMLKLKVKYFGHLMRRADLMEKSLTPGKIEGKRRRGWQRMRWWDSITNSMNVNVSKLWETVKHWKPGMPQSMRSQRVRHDCEAERQQYTCYSISLSLYHFNVSFLAWRALYFPF